MKKTKKSELDEILDVRAGLAVRLRLSFAKLFESKAWMIVKKEFGLTNREIQIAILMCKGYHWREISDKLNIKYGTFKSHNKALFRKVGVSNGRRLVLKLILATGELLPEEEKDMVF